MPGLSEQQLLFSLLALAVVLAAARASGEVARRLGQPEVLGELFAGFLLGPSVLGAVLPGARSVLFLNSGVEPVLSIFSWVGAILLLLIAGIEVDLGILRSVARPGAFAAVGAIVPSLVGGAGFALIVLHRGLPYNFMLGIVLSVTAVSVAAKILIERDVLRREYAQVILAAGIASEVVVWLLVSVASATKGASPVLAAARSLVFAVAFFGVVIFAGRRFVFWAMRRVADSTHVVRGQLSLIVILTFLASAITQALGLHALLGAFAVGVLLSRAPRTNKPLLENVQTLTTGLFAPIFFVLAGMRVDIYQLGSPVSIGLVLLLFVVASLLKLVFATLGARLGGLGAWQAALVGVGLNMKGGTDVIVAIVGVELGLLSTRVYTMYAIVAMLTVLIAPTLITHLERKAPPTEGEVERLEHEEATRRSYVSGVERVLVPIGPHLCPELTASVIERIAQAKLRQKEIFDITELVVNVEEPRDTVSTSVKAISTIDRVEPLENVELRQKHIDVGGGLRLVVDAAKDYDVIAIGARQPQAGQRLSLGRLQDAIVHRAETSVLVTISDDDRVTLGARSRILVPINGLEYSLSAADTAAYLAQGSGSEVVLLNVAYPTADSMLWQEGDHRRLLEAANGVMGEAAFRIARLGVPVSKRVKFGPNAAGVIRDELATGDFALVVLGAVDRGASAHFSLGRTAEAVLTCRQVPKLLLVSRQTVHVDR